MTHYEQVCTKKDKRLLVLLALGALVLLLDQDFLSSGSHGQTFMPSWFEYEGPSYRLIRLNGDVPQIIDVDALSRNRIKLTDKEITRSMAFLNDHQVISFIAEKGKGREQVPVPTPRLSIFLGLPVAINQANYEELLLLPGIGPYLAGNIMSYRQKYGRISGEKELESVPGVGPKTVSRISPLLVFD